MNFIKENYTKVLAIILIIILVFTAYFLFTPQENTKTIDIAEGNRAEIDRTVAMLRDVRQITINQEIFSDHIFTSLQETTTKLPQYKLGRENPFSPLPTSTIEKIEEDNIQPGEDEIIEISI